MRHHDSIPAALAERVRRFELEGGTPVAARDAATVLLLRDAPRGPEVLLLRRVASMAFAAGMHAFPGGGVDPRDGTTDVAWAGPEPVAWAARLGSAEPLARALVCAAVRETFEECGVLLAGPSPSEVVADVAAAEWEASRQALLARARGLGDLLAAAGLVLRSDLLRAWSRWVTPEPEPRRYDARFFVAALPTGQATRDVGGESDATVWLRPAEALAAADAGDIALMPPTSQTLREIGGYRTVAEVLAAAEQRDLAPVRPRLVVHAGGGHVLLPGDPGFDR
jgi:8-oxo-dGTP pyrophosphatase MutT (NUDIX family)